MRPTARGTALLLLLFLLTLPSDAFYLSSRIITLDSGSLQGLIVQPNHKGLGRVEVFLGVPYAAPPVGSLRFMPPMSPLPWSGIRRYDTMPPVCPQKLPDVGSRREALRRMPEGRYNYLQRLLPMLRNQSEDCLKLSIYSPFREDLKSVLLPVMVYIHGESYEWNSGNPYDGSVLASYGDVIVITFNFRLGVLGFLRAALNLSRESNFGLLDQIAALYWIKNNIAKFGGDPENITIFGHGTGAALANLLLVTPVAQMPQIPRKLFQRAILMGGSALSRWAITWDPYPHTIQVAKALNCPTTDTGDGLARCLRSKSIEELLSVPLQNKAFMTPLGPVVDGIVIKDDPKKIMASSSSTLGNYDVMYGVTLGGSFNMLSANEVRYGMTRRRRNQLLNAYITNNFDYSARDIYSNVLYQYSFFNSDSEIDERKIRDQALEILSDAQITAPVINLGDYHSDLNTKSFFYVFGHQSIYGDYPVSHGAIHGEELPYVFGAPLVGGFSHFHLNYTHDEVYLSELIMTLWANFAKTGNPNIPTPQGYKSGEPGLNWMENLKTLWPRYDKATQQYLHIDMQVVSKLHYKTKKMGLWNHLIPEMMASSEPPLYRPFGTAATIPLIPPIRPEVPNIAPTYIPTSTTPPTDQERWHFYQPNPVKKTFETQLEPPVQPTTVIPPVYAGTPISIVILIGIVILFLNCVAMAGVYYQRDKLRLRAIQQKRASKSKKADPSQPSTSKTTLLQVELKEDTNSPTVKESSPKKGSPRKKESGREFRQSDSRESEKSSSRKEGIRRNKSEASSIYSEIERKTNEKKPFSVKFRNGLASKELNKSTSSIASKSSIRSTTSRTSVRSTSSIKPLKKNASCQSLPTEEYGWGITKEMITTAAEIENRMEDVCSANRQQVLATLRKKNFPKVLPDPPIVQAATLPRVRPSPPPRTISLTSQELEDIQYVYQKKPILKSKVSSSSEIESFYGTEGGEAPATAPGLTYETSRSLPQGHARQRNKDCEYESVNRHSYKQAGGGERLYVKKDTVSHLSPTFTSKPFGVYANAVPVITYGTVMYSQFPEPATASVVTRPKETIEVPCLSSTSSRTKVQPLLEQSNVRSPVAPSKSPESLSSIMCSDGEDTGTVKRKKSAKSSAHATGEKNYEKPLKSALKQTSAYDKQKTNNHSKANIKEDAEVKTVVKSASVKPAVKIVGSSVGDKIKTDKKENKR